MQPIRKNEEISFDYDKYLNKCNQCEISFLSIQNLRSHLETKHHIQFDVQNLTFWNAQGNQNLTNRCFQY